MRHDDGPHNGILCLSASLRGGDNSLPEGVFHTPQKKTGAAKGTNGALWYANGAPQ